MRTDYKISAITLLAAVLSGCVDSPNDQAMFVSRTSAASHIHYDVAPAVVTYAYPTPPAPVVVESAPVAPPAASHIHYGPPPAEPAPAPVPPAASHIHYGPPPAEPAPAPVPPAASHIHYGDSSAPAPAAPSAWE